MTYSEFQTVIRSKRFAPVYLFYGEEDFLIDECIHAVIENTIDAEARAFNLDVMDGSKADAKDVVAHASSFPMMGSRRVVVVKEFEKLAATDTEKEILAAYIERPLDSTCLIAVWLDLRANPTSW